jgi:hypothetical protein
MKTTGCRFVKVTGRLDKPIGLDDGRPLEPAEQKDWAEYQLGGKPSYDAINLPHRAALSLINWPIGIAPENPDGLVPMAAGDASVLLTKWRNDLPRAPLFPLSPWERVG